MFCKNCGNELREGAAFCANCGTPVTVQAAEPVVEVVEEVVVEPVMEEVVEPTPEPTPAQETASTQQATQNSQSTPVTPAYQAPALKLPTERKMWKMIVFGILTLGIYPMVIYIKMVDELNIAASRYDGQRTTNYYISALLTGITLGIYGIWYFHTLSKRIGAEVKRRGYDYKFGASSFWLWNVLGCIIIVGPFVYLHKLTKCMNMINESYNYYG